ncbi:MAG TPA: hypothetical protein VK864_18820, partial [Longimicrobiales bacterium]|nr:hypothetical protein [Longimicrobiales bacterium]
DLVAAYSSGDEPAFQRVVQYFRAERSLSWNRPAHKVRLARLRRAIRERLDRRTAEQRMDEPLALADAQLLIARSEGYASWGDLAK